MCRATLAAAAASRKRFWTRNRMEDAAPALAHLRQLAAGAQVPLSASEERLLGAARQVSTPTTADEQRIDCAAVLGALRQLAVNPLDAARSRLEGVATRGRCLLARPDLPGLTFGAETQSRASRSSCASGRRRP